MADRVVVCAGTTRGLFLFESNKKRKTWKRRGPLIAGWSVYHAMVDTRGTPRIHAAAVSETFATNAFSGPLRAKSLKGAKKPPVPPKAPPKALHLAKKWGISVEPRVWHIAPGGPKEKNVLYAGTAPAGLFKSTDAGNTWKELKALSSHKSRKEWMPGAGGLALHSIQVDPMDPKRIFVGISAAGAFRSADGGKKWKPINEGVGTMDGKPRKSDVGT